jgi:hypothetical protein
MTYKDLRFGNWVKGHLTGIYLQVNWLVMKHMEDGNIQSVYTPDIPVYEPIPLTPETLVKAGFKRDKQGHYRRYLQKGRFFVLRGTKYDYKSDSHIDCLKVMYYDDMNVKHVHQIQNLYFALTGEELEISL